MVLCDSAPARFYFQHQYREPRLGCVPYRRRVHHGQCFSSTQWGPVALGVRTAKCATTTVSVLLLYESLMFDTLMRHGAVRA